ncbi:MAG: family 10 glycosylhydrolase [Planctomycetota bacterium]
MRTATPRFTLLAVFVTGLLVLAAAAVASAQDIVIDNAGAGFSVLTGNWSTGSSATDKYGADYRYASSTTGAATATVEFRPTIATAGLYEVGLWYPEGGNRAPDAPITIEHADGSGTLTLNQQTLGGQFLRLGVFPFNAGNTGRVVVGNNCAATGSVILADAVRFRPVTPGADEYRGIWVSRFEWPSANATTMRANLRTIMTNAVRGGFNSVVLQVRGQADTMYPSPDEPWSPIIGGASPGFDPLRMALDEAHARGLQLHAYFNTHVYWSGSTAPAAGSHLYYQHGNPNDPAHRDWMVADSSGTVQQAAEDGYWWLSPGHPDVQAYLRKQIMHLVRTYPDLDGIHFDRIRMPGTTYSYDATSNARRAGPGNPDSLPFDDWMRNQFTRFLADTMGEVRRESRTIQLSAAPLGLYRQERYAGYPSGYLYGYNKVFQDAQAWLAAGGLDWIAPQIYWADGDGANPDFSEVLPDWVTHNAGRHIYAGSDADASVVRTQNEIAAARSLGANGLQYWSYSTAATNDHFTSLAAGSYAAYAKQPDQPWRTAATTGHVVGTITDYDTGLPVTDAWITLSGESYTALSSGDGFWSWLDLPPGSYTFDVSHPGYDPTQVTVDVTAGGVTTANVAFGAPAGGGGGGGGGVGAGAGGCAAQTAAGSGDSLAVPFWQLQLLLLLVGLLRIRGRRD